MLFRTCNCRGFTNSWFTKHADNITHQPTSLDEIVVKERLAVGGPHFKFVDDHVRVFGVSNGINGFADQKFALYSRQASGRS